MPAYWIDWQLWVAMLASLFLLAYLNCVESAFLAVNDVRVQHRAEGGDPRAVYLAAQLADREGLLSLLLFLTEVASCFLAIAFLHLLAGFRGQPGRSEVLFLCLAGLAFVLAQRVPSVMGARYADRLALSVVWPFRHLTHGPLRALHRLVRALVRSTGRLLGSKLHGVEPGFKIDELRLLLEESEHRGVLDAQANRMLQAILGLGKVPARHAMLALGDMVMVPEDTPVQEAARTAADTGFSRLPIHGTDRARVRGYVHVIDLLVGTVRTPEKPVREVKQDILRLGPDESLVAALRLFRSSRYHMAAVVDDTGHALGLLTVEDVLERIVGRIEDEHDRGVGAIREAGEGEWVTDPQARIEDLERVCGLELPAGAYRTLGGFLASLGPEAGSGRIVVAGQAAILIEEAEDRSVPRIRIRKESEES